MTVEGKTGYQIFAIGPLAAEKTKSLAKENEAVFRENFLPEMTDRALALTPADVSGLSGVCSLFETKEGFYNALWDLGEALCTGLEIDIRKVPVVQETVEIFEYFDLDPYQEPSGGTYIAAADRPQKLIELLEKRGAVYEMIGYTAKGPARIIKNAGRVRYLDKNRSNDKEVTES